MREVTIPAAELPEQNSIARYAFDNAVNRGGDVTLRRQSTHGWRDVTAAEFAEQITQVARGFLAAGLRAGDRVILMSRTSYEWTLFDFAVLAAGGVVVPVYETSSAEQVDWILGDSGARFAVVETEAHAGLMTTVMQARKLSVQLWILTGGAEAALTALGLNSSDDDVRNRLDATKPSDVASLIYTSGTTGLPKGCVLTHANFLAEVAAVSEGLEPLLCRGNSTLLFIPLAHVLGRVIEVVAIANCTVLGHTSDTANLLSDLQTFRPTFVLSVPRVFEKVHIGAKQKAHAEHKGWIFDRAEQVAIAYSQTLDIKRFGIRNLDVKRAGRGITVQHQLFELLVYRRIREALGGRCVAAISGGAPLSTRLGHFFRGIGLPIYEGYGLTETTGGVCLNLEGFSKIGTVGRPVPGMSIGVSADGELLVSGPVVFSSYWRSGDPSGVRDPAGMGDHLSPPPQELFVELNGRSWLRTGDLGELDPDGFVTITGRRKELIITAAGKNVSPTVLQDRVRAHWLVGECLVVGDQKPYIAALITIDAEAWPTWLRQQGKPAGSQLADFVTDVDLRAELQRAITGANEAVSHAEAIKKFVILSESWTEAGGQLTPSLKLKRRVVIAEHTQEIAALYAVDDR